MNDHTVLPECAQALATQGTRIDNLEQWQRRQNGSLQRMEESVGKLHDKLDAALERVYDRMDARVEKVGVKTNGVLTVVVSALSSGLIALLVVILTHALGGAK